MNRLTHAPIRAIAPIVVAAAGLLLSRCGGGNSAPPGPSPETPSLSALSINPTTVLGGDAVDGSVTLSRAATGEGATVTLSTDNAAVVNVPANVRVAAGATGVTFRATTSPVNTQTMVRISGLLGVTQSQVLTVTPQPPATTSLASISLVSSSVLGGNSVQGTVTMTAPAPPSGVTVSLTSSDAGVAMVPSTVGVGSGATTGSFAVSTRAVGGTIPITITAAYGGTTQSASLSVTPPVEPTVLVANPNGPYDGYACLPGHPITTCGTAASLITMTAKGSTSTPNPIAHWYWTCGQAGNPNCVKDEITPSFSYTRDGFNNTTMTYTVTLIIEDTRGNRSAPATTTVLVRNRY